MAHATDDVARYVWDGQMHGQLANFDEYCAVMGEISDALRREL